MREPLKVMWLVITDDLPLLRQQVLTYLEELNKKD